MIKIIPGIIGAAQVALDLHGSLTFLSDLITGNTPWTPVNMTKGSAAVVGKQKKVFHGPSTYGGLGFDTEYTATYTGSDELQLNSVTLFTLAGILDFDLSFNSDGYPIVAYETASGVSVYDHEAVSHTSIVTGGSNPFITLDTTTNISILFHCISGLTSGSNAVDVGSLSANISISTSGLEGPVNENTIGFGTSNGSITVAASSDYNLSGGVSFSAACFQRNNPAYSGAAFRSVIAHKLDSNNMFGIYHDLSRVGFFTVISGTRTNYDYAPITDFTFYHYEIRFFDGNMYAFFDGTLMGSAPVSYAGNAEIHFNGEPGVVFTHANGWMDEIVVSTGIKRDSEDFTPMTAPITNTATLANASNILAYELSGNAEYRLEHEGYATSRSVTSLGTRSIEQAGMIGSQTSDGFKYVVKL